MISKVREQENLLRKELIKASNLVSGHKSFDTNQAVEIFIDLIIKQESINELLFNQYVNVSQEYRDVWTKDYIQGKTMSEKNFVFEDEYNLNVEFYREIQEKIKKAKVIMTNSLQEDKEINDYKESQKKTNEEKEEI